MKINSKGELLKAVVERSIPAGCMLNVAVAVLVMKWRLGEHGRWLNANGEPTPWTLNTFKPSEEHAAANVVIRHMSDDEELWWKLVMYVDFINENSIGFMLDNFMSQPYYICLAAVRVVLIQERTQ